MGLLIKILILAWVTFMASSCSKNTATTTVEPTKTAIKSVNGDHCPIFEEELVKTAEKSIFDDCDLRRNPQIFDGKLVRIKSTYRFMIHGSYLSRGTCAELSRDVLNTVAVGFESKRDMDYIQGLRIPIDVVAIGKFSLVKPNEESDTIYDNTPFQFSLVCLEKASSVTSVN